MLKIDTNPNRASLEWSELQFGDIVKEFNERTTTEDEDELLSCAVGGIYLNTELFSHQRGVSNIGYKKIKRNDLILSTQNLHLGNANVNTRFDHGIISPAYKTYHVVGCDPGYLSYWLLRDSTNYFFYKATTTGASQCRRNVEWDLLYSQKVRLPSLREQKSIANVLAEVDCLIENKKNMLESAQNRKIGIFNRLLSNNDASHFATKKLEELGTFSKGGTLAKNDLASNGTPCVLYGHLYTEYGEEIENVKYHTNKQQGTMAVKGDVLFPASTTADPVSLISPSVLMSEKALLGGDIIRFHPNEDVSGRYISYYVNLVLKKKLSAYAQGSTIIHIQSKNIAPREILIPSYELQEKVADLLSSVNELIESIGRQIHTLENIKKGLIQEYFA